MDTDFWKGIDRLEELAGKIKPGEWEYEPENENLRHNVTRVGVIIPELGEYISAANPAMIKEMTAEMRRLKDENAKLKNVSELTAKKLMQLYKEADWLAERLQSVCELSIHVPCNRKSVV